MVYVCDNREGGGGELDMFNNKNGNNVLFMIINKIFCQLKNKLYIRCCIFIIRLCIEYYMF